MPPGSLAPWAEDVAGWEDAKLQPGAGPSAARPLAGRTFAPRLRGGKGKPRAWCYNEWGGKAWARTHRHKLYRDGRLFDLDADPAEKRPIPPGQAPDGARAARTALQAVLDRLKKA